MHKVNPCPPPSTLEQAGTWTRDLDYRTWADVPVPRAKFSFQYPYLPCLTVKVYFISSKKYQRKRVISHDQIFDLTSVSLRDIPSWYDIIGGFKWTLFSSVSTCQIFVMVISPTFMMILTAKTSLRLVLKWRLKWTKKCSIITGSQSEYALLHILYEFKIFG